MMTRSFKALLAIAAAGIAMILWRLYAGLGATTAMSDGYPWGIWIAFDVVTGTALACGGYAVAILVYILNRGKYHPLIRPAILTSALGYSIAGLSVVLDIGRWWSVWKVPLYVGRWNGNSVLLEVAICIMAYTVVLWIELAPAILEKWPDSRISRRMLPLLEKSLIWIAALGIVLPTMHQSSLGSLMLLGGPKLHPLWNSAFLPLFYLTTCLAMGYSIVVFEAAFSNKMKQSAETPMLGALQKIASWAVFFFVVARFLDIAFRGQVAKIMTFDLYGVMFWIETLLFLAPLAMMKSDLTSLVRSALLLIVAGALYRFDTFLVAFDPGPGWHYFPSVPEIFITLGLIALELAAYVFIVTTFPILGGTVQHQEN